MMRRFLHPVGAAILVAGVVVVAFVAIGTRPPLVSDPPSQGADRAAALSAFLAETAPAEGTAPRGPWVLSLPQDHGSHPEAPAETWTISAALTAADGARFDLFLSLLRYDVAGAEGGMDAPSPWDVSTLWAGQIVLIPSAPAPALAAERYARIAGAAGHDAAAQAVWIDDWTMSYGAGDGAGGLRLRASVGAALLDLSLAPDKPPLAPEGADAGGPRGFALPRLAVTGSIVIDAEGAEVSGTAWLDRSWGDLPLPGGPIGYDRLIVHLSDGSDLSLLRTRRIGRAGAATLDAVLIDPDGTVTYLEDAAIELEVRRAEGNIPAAWRLTGAGVDITATVRRWTVQDVLAPVRLGPAEVEGRVNGAAVAGRGVLVLTEGGEE